MFNELKTIPAAWSRAWKSTAFRKQIVFSLLLLVVACLSHFHLLKVWQNRPGMVINDLILTYLPPMDFSGPIFFLEYSTLVLVLIFILAHPEKFSRGLQVYSAVLMLRTLAIYLVPLEPPREMIILYDPFANFFLHAPGVTVTKDLFFSGHVSALTVFMLIATTRFIKAYAAVATILVAIFIIWQHVHYSVDVLFAPIVAYLVFKVIERAHGQVKGAFEFQDAR